MKKIHSICVYCGSSSGQNPLYQEAAYLFGTLIAKNNHRLVYGGGTRGLMGAVARGVLDHGGEVLGIIPTFLLEKEASRSSLQDLSEVIETPDMHTRKHLMFQHSDAFVTLPGGIGTVEEIVEMLTWGQLGRHDKAMAFANINNFWKPILDLFDHMKGEGFIHTAQQVQPLIIDNVEDIIPALHAHAQMGKAKNESLIEKM